MNPRRTIALACCALGSVLSAATPGQAPQKFAGAPIDEGDAHVDQTLIHLESPAVVADRLRWWADARFGMFIHWGLYSQWGSHFPGPDGTLRDGKSEHMMRHLQIPRREYAKIADVFNSTQFDANTFGRRGESSGNEIRRAHREAPRWLRDV